MFGWGGFAENKMAENNKIKGLYKNPSWTGNLQVDREWKIKNEKSQMKHREGDTMFHIQWNVLIRTYVNMTKKRVDIGYVFCKSIMT